MICSLLSDMSATFYAIGVVVSSYIWFMPSLEGVATQLSIACESGWPAICDNASCKPRLG